MWRCLLRVLCPVRRPVTTLDCALLKDIMVIMDNELEKMWKEMKVS
jgi:hypothetical protein